MKTPRAVCLVAVSTCVATRLLAQLDPPLTTQRVAFGLIQPTGLAAAPGDPADRLYVTERSGRVLIIEDGAVLPVPFLDLSTSINDSFREWGLLGLAFHPNYESNGFLFISYNAGAAGDSYIARLRRSADPDSADPASLVEILHVPQFNQIHRGGWLAFGPDARLYASLGDGGGQGDPERRAQDLSRLQGKILRLDADGPDGTPGTEDDDGLPLDPDRNYQIPTDNPFLATPGAAGEIWCLGLRNPWRCSFDHLTGDLYIGDVGWSQREEVSFLAPEDAPGANLGWRCLEGTRCTGLAGCGVCPNPAHVMPVIEYDHTVGQAVAAGVVYRGCALPSLRGTFFYGDTWTGKLWSARIENGQATDITDRTLQLRPDGGLDIAMPVAFGQDTAGEVFIVDYLGEVYKLVPDGVPPESCCRADFDGDGFVTGTDFDEFVLVFEAGGPDADFDSDGFLTGLDFDAFVAAFEAGC